MFGETERFWSAPKIFGDGFAAAYALIVDYFAELDMILVENSYSSDGFTLSVLVSDYVDSEGDLNGGCSEYTVSERALRVAVGEAGSVATSVGSVSDVFFSTVLVALSNYNLVDAVWTLDEGDEDWVHGIEHYQKATGHTFRQFSKLRDTPLYVPDSFYNGDPVEDAVFEFVEGDAGSVEGAVDVVLSGGSYNAVLNTLNFVVDGVEDRIIQVILGEHPCVRVVAGDELPYDDAGGLLDEGVLCSKYNYIGDGAYLAADTTQIVSIYNDLTQWVLGNL